AVTDLKIKCLGTVLSDMTMYVGDVLTMTYEATPEQEDPTVSWSSDNQDVFTILQTGEITGVSAGEAHLTLTVNGVSAECLIRVRSKPA
ncbi:MAG: Ig-like domain-containing protein, partial [Oscillospiraceae bacterium]|nr:Ig-like domain-containing protein [Oscillospiraceae bacterium]